MKTYEIKHEPITPGYYSPAVWQDEILNDKFEVIQERKLLKESEFIKTGEPKSKYNIYYYKENGELDGLPEFYSYDGVTPEVSIRYGYVPKT